MKKVIQFIVVIFILLFISKIAYGITIQFNYYETQELSKVIQEDCQTPIFAFICTDIYKYPWDYGCLDSFNRFIKKKNISLSKLKVHASIGKKEIPLNFSKKFNYYIYTWKNYSFKNIENYTHSNITECSFLNPRVYIDGNPFFSESSEKFREDEKLYIKCLKKEENKRKEFINFLRNLEKEFGQDYKQILKEPIIYFLYYKNASNIDTIEYLNYINEEELSITSNISIISCGEKKLIIDEYNQKYWNGNLIKELKGNTLIISFISIVKNYPGGIVIVFCILFIGTLSIILIKKLRILIFIKKYSLQKYEKILQKISITIKNYKNKRR